MPTSLEKYLNPAGLDETVLNIRQIAEGLEADMQELPYARPDGLYPDMTVGAVIGADETAQWAQRESTGTGSATVRSVQGAAVVWNQLIRQPNTSDTVLNGAVARVRKTDDGTVTLNGTAVGTGSSQYVLIAGLISITSGHKYYLTKHNDSLNYYINVSGSNNHMTNVASIFTAGEDRVNAEMYMVVPIDGYTFDNAVFIPQLFDLTVMFGSGNEPATVEEFERMYPASYYPYSAPTLKPVQIAGIASTTAQGGELDAIEWTAQTLWALEVAASETNWVQDILTATEVVRKVGVFDLGTLTWTRVVGDPNAYFITTSLDGIALRGCKVQMNKYEAQYEIQTGTTAATDLLDKHYSYINSGTYRDRIVIRDDAYQTADALKASLSGVICTYALVTPTTQPISPALPMTYKVQQGGSESVIVPDGEVSAAPVLTVAEPVNMSTELARIWAAIEQLQSRGTAQLSRADAASIEEVQKDTTDVVEIDTTKEVQE